MKRGWDFPQPGFFKINAHDIILNEPLPDGNTTGISIVVRDDEEVII